MGPVKRCAVHRTKIAYGAEPSQFGHLYHVADPADRPRRMRPVVLVHGGYWTTEFSLIIESAIARQYAERGALVWNVEYRRVGEAGGGWPGTGADVRAAIEALDTSVADALDPDLAACVDWADVAVVGHSAGGHLALWSVAHLGARTSSTVITTVVAQASALDLVGAGRAARPSVEGLMGATYDEAPEQYRQASPIEQEPFDAHVVAIHGTLDTAIPVDVSRHYVETVSARGQSAELVVVPDEGHDAFVDPRSVCNRHTLRALGI